MLCIFVQNRSNLRSLKSKKISGIFLWCCLCAVQFAPLLNIDQWLSVALYASLSKPVFSVLLRNLLTVFFSRIERSCKRWFSVMLFVSFYKTLNSAFSCFNQKDFSDHLYTHCCVPFLFYRSLSMVPQLIKPKPTPMFQEHH